MSREESEDALRRWREEDGDVRGDLQNSLAAALHEATKSLHYTEHTTAPDDARAAMAVAAFLRALPRPLSVKVALTEDCEPTVIFRADWLILARAVEAAAMTDGQMRREKA